MSTEATITTDDTDSACQTERIDYTWITPAAINDELERIGDGGCYLAEMMGDPSDRDVAAMALIIGANGLDARHYMRNGGWSAEDAEAAEAMSDDAWHALMSLAGQLADSDPPDPDLLAKFGLAASER